MLIEFDNAESAGAAMVKAAAVTAASRDQAVAVQQNMLAAFAAHGKLIARAAAGGEVTEAEWDESESALLRLGRQAERFAAILAVQKKTLEAVTTAAIPFAGREGIEAEKAAAGGV